MNVAVSVVKTLGNARGFYRTENGEIVIAADASVEVSVGNGKYVMLKGTEAAQRIILGHEVTHRLKAVGGKSYATRIHDVLNSLIEKIKAHVTWTKALAELKTVEDGRKLLAEVIRSEDVGNEDNMKFSFKGRTKDGIRIYKSDFAKNVPIEDRIKEFKKRIDIIFNLGAVTLKTDTKKILVKGDAFTAQKIFMAILEKCRITRWKQRFLRYMTSLIFWKLQSMFPVTMVKK